MLNPLTHCDGLGIEPASWHCRDAADPGVPQQVLPEIAFELTPQMGQHKRISDLKFSKINIFALLSLCANNISTFKHLFII